MLTPAELRSAVEQLDRLLRLVDAETVTASSGERAYLAGSRDALAAVLRPRSRGGVDDQGGHDRRRGDR